MEKYYVGKVQPLSDVLIQEYKDNLAELARLDKERIMLEEAKNKLESYIYYIKNKLIDDEENIAKISTEEQREELSTLAREAEDWLFDEGDTASPETLRSKLDVLMAPAEKVWFRLKEATERPAAVKALREKLSSIEDTFNKWVANVTHITEEEKGDLCAKIESARKWLSDKEEEQAAKAPHEDPAFTSDEVPVQVTPIQKFLAKLTKKPKPKVKKNETEAKSEENGNETAPESKEGSEADDASGDAKEAEKEETNEEGKGEETVAGDEEL